MSLHDSSHDFFRAEELLSLTLRRSLPLAGGKVELSERRRVALLGLF